MATLLRSVMIGRGTRLRTWWRVAGLLGGLFLVTLLAYAIGLFTVSGGLIWIPVHAALLGLCASCAVGYVRSGLVVAWAAMYAAMLGWHAYRSVFVLSNRSIPEKFAYFFRLDSLAFFAIQAFVLGLIAFSAGVLIRRGIGALSRWEGF